MKRYNERTTLLISFCVVLMSIASQGQTPQEDAAVRPRYTVTSLGTLGGTFSTAQGINNSGWLTGDANLTGDQTEHATVWRNGVITDLGTLGGPNSDALNDVHGRGLIVFHLETSG